MTVEGILRDNELPYHAVRLGEVELDIPPAAEQLKQIHIDLQKVGYEILDD